MRERPILFSAPMVRALLAGTKTQTRRVVKEPISGWLNNANGSHKVLDGRVFNYSFDEPLGTCPYGQPGDRLWVRESFWGCDAPGWGDQPCVVYDDEWPGKEYRPAEIRPWARKFGRIPSIHMPRHACRLILEITGVRVERLHKISEADARAEGCPFTWDGKQYEPPPPEVDSWQGYGRASFSLLWSQINGADSLKANPWVWVVEFRVLHPRTDGGGRE